MDIQTIIFLIGAFALGGGLVWILLRRSGISQKENLQNVIQDLEQRINSLKEENTGMYQAMAEAENTTASRIKEAEQILEDKYEQLLQRVKNENAHLDSALKLATEGKIEESIQEQLREAEKSIVAIREMEAQLVQLRADHATLLKEKETLLQDKESATAECGKLSKQIKMLEDDIEEAEEEQEALEKKLKAKGRELQEVNEELDKSNRDNKRLQSDLEQRDNELANRIEELKRKSNSIEFIQEILSAPETGAQDVKAMYKAINFFESFIRGQFMDCNAYLYNTYTSLSYNDKTGREGFVEKKQLFLQRFEEWASVKRKSWLDKKTTIAFVGEFSAGKTSIVNRILSQDNPKIPLLPVSAKATTAIPTYIAGGVAETYNFVTPDDKLKSINEEIFKKVSKEVLDEIKGVSSLIKYFVMTYKNPNLDGLSILDTPGFNSNDEDDKNRTIGVINECDALFWVFDVNAGTVNRSSISLIKEKLNKPLIVVINKVDTKPESEVDKVEALIRKTLSEAGLQVKCYIRFSAKAPLNDIMAPIHSITHDENRDAFVSIVEEDLQQLMGIISNAVKEADNKYNNCSAKSVRITEKFNNGMQGLYNACNTAAGIPQWVRHTFSKDRYEMTQAEGQRLIKLLEDIATTRSNNLAKIYSEEMEAVADEQQAYSDLVDLKASWQKVEDCMNEFKKTTKQLR